VLRRLSLNIQQLMQSMRAPARRRLKISEAYQGLRMAMVMGVSLVILVRMIQVWSDYLDGLIAGANVISLRASK
jgi:hypothetical protein